MGVPGSGSPASFAVPLPGQGSPSSIPPNQQMPNLNQLALMNQFTPAQQAALQQSLRMNAGSPISNGMQENQAALTAALQARMVAMQAQVQQQQQAATAHQVQSSQADADADFVGGLTTL